MVNVASSLGLFARSVILQLRHNETPKKLWSVGLSPHAWHGIIPVVMAFIQQARTRRHHQQRRREAHWQTQECPSASIGASTIPNIAETDVAAS